MSVVTNKDTPWADAEEVSVDFSERNFASVSDVYMWLFENLGVQGTGWEVRDNQNRMFVRFMFEDKKYATLFRLRWGHLVATQG